MVTVLGTTGARHLATLWGRRIEILQEEGPKRVLALLSSNTNHQEARPAVLPSDATVRWPRAGPSHFPRLACNRTWVNVRHKRDARDWFTDCDLDGAATEVSKEPSAPHAPRRPHYYDFARLAGGAGGQSRPVLMTNPS